MAVKPYDKTTHDGKVVDVLTSQALIAAEEKLGYPLTIVQGSYNRGVAQSAGTHDGGGAVDLAPFDYKRKVRVLRDLGFAAWYRPAIAGLWGAHIHAILIGNQRLSPAAQNQVLDYRQGLNGLADNGRDPDQYRPNPIPTFKFTEPRKPTRGKRVDQAIDLLERTSRAGKVRKARIKLALDNLRGIEPW